MEYKQHNINVPRTAHYYTLGSDPKHAEFIWLVFHGYGQLASRIIQKFDHLDLSRHFFIAPEGLSRFYWNQNSDQVAASWMTRLDRLEEISDYIGMLDRVYNDFEPEIGNKSLVILAFSQGTATAWRWLMHRKPDNLKTFVQWAGGFPPEIDYGAYSGYIDSRQFLFVHGLRDKFFTKEVRKEIEDHIDQRIPSMQLMRFDGEHRLNREFLSKKIIPLIIN